MDINIRDIKQLREEAERDLDALRRVEAMLQRQRNGHEPAKASGSLFSQGKGMVSKQDGVNSGNMGVKIRVGEIVRESGDQGIRPRDVAEIINGQFTFKSRVNAAACVSTALARFRKKGTIVKTDQGRYVWRGLGMG